MDDIRRLLPNTYEDYPHSHEDGEFISSLIIQGLRGYVSPQKVRFAHPNGKIGSGLTIICGANNSGKSSIVSALSRFSYRDNRPPFEKDEKHTTISSKITLEDCGGDSASIEYTKNNTHTINSSRLGSNLAFAFIDSKIIWKATGAREVDQKEHEQKNGLSNENQMGRIDNSDRNFYGKNFGNFLITIRDDTRRKKKFNDFLKTIIPSFRDWSIRTSRPNQEGYRKYHIKIRGYNKQVHSADFLGGGMLRLLHIGAAIFIPNYGISLIIDEPELYLHPQAQKRLIEALAEYSANYQVVLVTHSPHFVRWQDIQNGAYIVHTHLDLLNGENKVVNLDAQDRNLQSLLRLNNSWNKPFLLDAVAKEIFFTNKIVFLEGQEDVSLLAQLANSSNIKLTFDFFGYGSHGAGNIRPLIGLAVELGIKTGAIYDGDQKTKIEYDKAIQEYGDKVKILRLNKDDIRDKNYPDKPSKKGYFNDRGEIKSEKDKEYLMRILKKLNR